MADWAGYLLWDPRTEPYIAIIPVTDELVLEEDIADYSDSYEPAEGCDD